MFKKKDNEVIGIIKENDKHIIELIESNNELLIKNYELLKTKDDLLDKINSLDDKINDLTNFIQNSQNKWYKRIFCF